jgi:hypothetical protein
VKKGGKLLRFSSSWDEEREELSDDGQDSLIHKNRWPAATGSKYATRIMRLIRSHILDTSRLASRLSTIRFVSVSISVFCPLQGDDASTNSG